MPFESPSPKRDQTALTLESLNPNTTISSSFEDTDAPPKTRRTTTGSAFPWFWGVFELWTPSPLPVKRLTCLHQSARASAQDGGRCMAVG